MANEFMPIDDAQPSDFCVGEPAERGWNNSCMPFKEVTHVTHIKHALRIIEDEEIRSDVVFDKSKLNDTRIRVVWLSPNDWPKSRYGNIGFKYDWQSLVQSKENKYWVEVIDYNPNACRILLTDKNYEYLKPYDPQKKNGPWWCDGTYHYFNNKFTLEIMYEDDLDIPKSSGLVFKDHDQYRCNINPGGTCKQAGASKFFGCQQFFGGLVARRLSIPKFLADSVRGDVENLLFMICARIDQNKGVFGNQLSVFSEDLFRKACSELAWEEHEILPKKFMGLISVLADKALAKSELEKILKQVFEE